MDVAVRRPGKGREQERKLEGVILRPTPSPLPSTIAPALFYHLHPCRCLPQGEGVQLVETFYL